MLEEHVELVAGTKILLGADPHRSDAELPVGPQLGRASPDAAIAGHDHEIEPGQAGIHSRSGVPTGTSARSS